MAARNRNAAIKAIVAKPEYAEIEPFYG